MGLGEKTMIVVTGDNGPTAWSHYYQGGKGEGAAPGLTGGLRGRKWSLYEGGLREPLIVRWSGTIPAGTVNRETVMAAVDLLPSLCALAGVSLPEGYEPDGLDLSEAMLGRAAPARSRPLFWEYNSLGGNIRPGLKKDQSPNLAMRDGDWKLLLNADGTGAELYNLACDPTEADNLASRNSERVATMRPLLLGWYHAVTEARRSGRP
jgi:arylsulfatase A-like enzyme